MGLLLRRASRKDICVCVCACRESSFLQELFFIVVLGRVIIGDRNTIFNTVLVDLFPNDKFFSLGSFLYGWVLLPAS
jgi:hypothetical protein